MSDDFWRVPQWAVAMTSRSLSREKRISPMAALLLGVLASHAARKDGEAYPSRKTLGEILGVDVLTITRLVAELAKRGVLQVATGNGRGNRSTFIITGPAAKGDATISDPTITLSSLEKGDATIGDSTITDQRIRERVIVDGSAPLSEESLKETAPLVLEPTKRAAHQAKPPRKREPSEASPERALQLYASKLVPQAYRELGEAMPGGRLAWNADVYRRLASWAVDAVQCASEEAGRIYEPTRVLDEVVRACVAEDTRKPVGFWLSRTTEAWERVRRDHRAGVDFQRAARPALSVVR